MRLMACGLLPEIRCTTLLAATLEHGTHRQGAGAFLPVVAGTDGAGDAFAFHQSPDPVMQLPCLTRRN